MAFPDKTAPKGVLVRGVEGKPDYLLTANGTKKPAYFFPAGLRSIDVDPATGLTVTELLHKIEDDFYSAYGIRYRGYELVTDDPPAT